MGKIAPIFVCFDAFNQSCQNDKAKQNTIKAVPPEVAIRASFPKVNNGTILKALAELSEVKFDHDDITYMNSLGVKLSFTSGKEVVDYLSQKETNIKFDKISPKSIYAQYSHQDNLIIINKDYKNTENKTDILAISEAILHEAGHAKDNDYNNSVQEEVDNLALIVLAHKYYSKKYPGIFNLSKSLIVTDGVNVYADLFYDKDPEKTALLKRLNQKYGYLPAYDVLHPLSPISQKIKENQV